MKVRALMGLIAVGALALAACGDDEKSNGDDTNVSSTDAPAATAAPSATEAPAPAATEAPVATVAPVSTGGASSSGDLPTELNVTEPLTETPKQGLRVGWLECQVPACQAYTPGFKDATEALGWELVTIPFDHADPATGLQQAIDADVDFITVTAVSASLVEEQLAAAADKGIGVFELFGIDEPDPENNNIYFQSGGPEFFNEQGKVLADWVVEDSGGAGNAVLVNIRDLAILNYGEEGLQNQFAETCDSCAFEVLPATFDDLGAGEIPQMVASYLQSNPATGYVLFSFSDMSLGVPEALADAGFDVKVGGINGDPNNVEAIVDGTQVAWTAQATDYFSWLAIDAMARQSVGMELDAEYLESVKVVPTFTIHTPELAQELIDESGGYWTGPTGFADAFRSMWGV